MITIKELCDVVRKTAYAIHVYHGHGHLEKVYENALVNRLRKAGLEVKQQHPLHVYDEDRTLIGEYFADLLVDGRLVVELKACRATADELYPTLNHLLSRAILRVSLAGDHQLHRLFFVLENSQQAFGVVQEQIRPLIGSKTTRETNRECIRLKDFLGSGDLFVQSAMTCNLVRKLTADVVDQGFS